MKIIPINKFATGNYIKIQNKIFKSFHSNPIHTLSKSNTKFIELFNFLNKSKIKKLWKKSCYATIIKEVTLKKL